MDLSRRGGGLIESGAITLGTFVAFILYQGRLLGPAMGLLGLVRNLQEARVSLERVAEILANEVAGIGQAECSVSRPGWVHFDRVSFAYAGNPPVLDQLDLRVAEGERVAIFGPSGSGKSTLVQLLFGLRAPYMGRVSVGTACSDAPGALGYAGCEPFLLHATIAENLRYGNGFMSDAELQRAAILAEAHGFISALPDGYNTIIGGRGLALSDGQRQRIGLARMVLRNPGIIVLDEAFSALDQETEVRVWRNLFSHFPDRTFLVISHRLQSPDGFHRLYRMEGGRLVQLGDGGLDAGTGTGIGDTLNLVGLDRVRPLRQGAARRQ